MHRHRTVSAPHTAEWRWRYPYILPVFSSSTKRRESVVNGDRTHSQRNDCCCYYLMHCSNVLLQQFHRINNFNGTDACVWNWFIVVCCNVSTNHETTLAAWLAHHRESKSDEKCCSKNRVENAEEKRVERVMCFVLCFSMKINSVFNELHLNEMRQCWEDTRELAIMSSFLRFMGALTLQHNEKNVRRRYEIDAREQCEACSTLCVYKYVLKYVMMMMRFCQNDVHEECSRMCDQRPWKVIINAMCV